MSDDEVTVSAILSKLTHAGGTTYVVIYPYHAQIRMIIERLGMGQLFDNWKRSIVEIATRIAEQGGNVEVWDFSGVAPETLEAIPGKSDHKTHLQYYWEAGHFKKALGDMVMARLLGNKQIEFGVALNNKNIDRWLKEDRKRLQEVLSAPSPLVTEVDDLFAHRLAK